MKLRLQGDSLRLRLTRPEVHAFCENGRVTEATHFAPSRALTCVLETTAATDTLRAHFDGHTIAVQVPRSWAKGWADSDRVGFEGEQPLPEDGTLTLLVEKDFACLHRDTDDPAVFPHPEQPDASAP